MNDYDRWCPSCGIWVPEQDHRVRADGKLRHKICDTATAPGAPVPDEILTVTEHSYIRDGVRYQGDPDAPTGPLTPGQVLCRVCQLDDRTRAASSPDDELCDVCRADTPKRVLTARRIRLGEAAEWFFGLPDLRDDETAAGSAQRDLVGERVDALMKLADRLQGHPLPYALVNAPKRVEELEANERTRKFVAKTLDRLKPQLVHRIAEVICPPLEVSADEVRGWSQLQIDEWGAIQRAAREAAERLVEKGLRFVPSDETVIRKEGDRA